MSGRRTHPNKEEAKHNAKYIIVLFDLRLPGTAERLDRERTAWQAQSDIEAFDENHVALLVRPGGARRMTR